MRPAERPCKAHAQVIGQKNIVIARSTPSVAKSGGPGSNGLGNWPESNRPAGLSAPSAPSNERIGPGKASLRRSIPLSGCSSARSWHHGVRCRSCGITGETSLLLTGFVPMAPTLVLSFQNLIRAVTGGVYFSQSGLPINTIFSAGARERRAPGSQIGCGGSKRRTLSTGGSEIRMILPFVVARTEPPALGQHRYVRQSAQHFHVCRRVAALVQVAWLE